MDNKELRRRTTEIAKDLIDYFGFKFISEDDIGDICIIKFERSKLLSKKVWNILITDAKKLEKKEFLTDIKKSNTILFSVSEVPSTVSKQFPLWYDLKNLKCCNLLDHYSRDIWSFLYETWAVVCDAQD